MLRPICIDSTVSPEVDWHRRSHRRKDLPEAPVRAAEKFFDVCFGDWSVVATLEARFVSSRDIHGFGHVGFVRVDQSGEGQEYAIVTDCEILHLTIEFIHVFGHLHFV